MAKVGHAITVVLGEGLVDEIPVCTRIYEEGTGDSVDGDAEGE